MRELRAERDKLHAEKEVVDAQNQMLWSCHERELARLNKERAIFARDIEAASLPRGEGLEAG